MPAKKEACALCEKKFTPWKGQKTAYWCINWCTQGSGLLCPDCNEAAEGLGALRDEEPDYLVKVWGSDIVKASKSTTQQQKRERRASESLKNWM